MFSPLKIVRFWLPALIFVVGAAMLVISPDIVGVEGAALMLGGGLGVVVSNRIHQMGIRGERDRDDEMGAREFFQKYGVWADEADEEVLDRAERAGDIEPRTPVAAAPSRGPVAPDDPGSTTPASAKDGRDDAAVATPGHGAPPADRADRHPHARPGRVGRRTDRRPPRR